MSRDFIFPAIITKFADDDYNVKFPDILEINTFGSNIKEAYFMAEDSLKLYVFDLYEESGEIPTPKDFFHVLEKNQTLIMVKVDLNAIIKEYDSKAVKKTLTIPSWLNKQAEENHINFSSVLQEALIQKLETV
jgi:predicted RNase H-like HicB family nuclease